MRSTSTSAQAMMMTAHVQCSGAYPHQAEPLSSTCPMPTPPQPHMTNENAQHMCHERCFCTFSLLHKQPLLAEPLQANCALLRAQQHSPELERTQNWTHCSALPRATRKPPKAHAPPIRTLMLKENLCKSRSDETGAAARVGRASGSAAAGVRLRLASLVTPATKARSHPARANHDMLQIHVM